MKQRKYKARKLRGNKNASRAYRRRNDNDINFQRKVVDARSAVRISNNQQQPQQPAVRRLGVAAERAVSGFRWNGKYHLGYTL